MKKGQAAYQAQNYTNALHWATEALKNIPNEQAAQQLQERAQQQISAAEALVEKYDAALKEAQTALNKSDFITATQRAGMALELRPNDPAAEKILIQSQQLRDLAAARRAFDQAAYEDALKICLSHPEADAFNQLAATNRAERAALEEARKHLATGDYAFFNQLQNQPVAGKTPFASLITQAANEQKTLGELVGLQQGGNWQALAARLAALSDPVLTNKPPFSALAIWSKSAAQQAENQKADLIFEEMLVWFNIKRPDDPYLHTAEAKKQNRIDGRLDDKWRQQCLTSLDGVEANFKKRGQPGQNDWENLIKDLRASIIRHE